MLAPVLEKKGERVTGSHIINVKMSRYDSVRNGTTAGSGFATQWGGGMFLFFIPPLGWLPPTVYSVSHLGQF
jgi:hypothetical protein